MTVLQQLSSRKYLKGVLIQYDLLVILPHSKLQQQEPSIQWFTKWLQFYCQFPINEATGEQLSQGESNILLQDIYHQLQAILFSQYQLQITFQEIKTFQFENQLPQKEENIADILYKLKIKSMDKEKEKDYLEIVREGVTIYDLNKHLLWQHLNEHPLT